MPKARAVRIREPGDITVLELDEVVVREPGPGEVLVEVAAAGLNRADLLQRRGSYPAPPGVPSDIPGLEYAGVVARTGPGVTAVKTGDRVMGIVAGGACSTHVVVHERETIRVPSWMSLVEAAAVPEAFLTAWDAIVLQAGLRAGESIVLHAVASGVGTAALQLATVAGATVLGTSRTQDKLARCAPLGLQHGIVTATGAFAADVLAKTQGRGAQVILDAVGAAYAEENLRSLAPGGRIVVIGTMGGQNAQLPLSLLMSKRARIIGTVLRSRPLEEKATLAQAFQREVVPLFEARRLAPVIDEVLPMASVREAHARMERNETFGKLVLSWKA